MNTARNFTTTISGSTPNDLSNKGCIPNKTQDKYKYKCVQHDYSNK